ncbi:MAG: hypothetical protein AB1512_13540 [Thermodesulfobacteriota bacterium]
MHQDEGSPVLFPPSLCVVSDGIIRWELVPVRDEKAKILEDVRVSGEMVPTDESLNRFSDFKRDPRPAIVIILKEARNATILESSCLLVEGAKPNGLPPESWPDLLSQKVVVEAMKKPPHGLDLSAFRLLFFDACVCQLQEVKPS